MSPPGFLLSLLILAKLLNLLQVQVLNFNSMRALLHLRYALQRHHFLGITLQIEQRVAIVDQTIWTWPSLPRQNIELAIMPFTESESSPWMSFSSRNQLLYIMGIRKVVLVLTPQSICLDHYIHPHDWIKAKWNPRRGKIACMVKMD